MKLSAIILNFRTADMAVDSIKASIAALINAPFDWSIIVVDNDSGDGSEEKLRTVCQQEQQSSTPGWHNVEVLQSGHNGGFGAGNNFGIRYALNKYQDLEYAYVLNSDAFPEKEAIKMLVDFLDQNKEYGIACSYIYGVDGEPHTTAFRFPSVPGEFEGAISLGPVTRILKKYVVPMGIPEHSIDVDWSAGASMMMRVELIHQVGLFDETFFLYFEETDLFKRATRQGWKARYVLESKVAHIGSASTGMKKWDCVPGYWFDSRRHYFIKNHGKFYFWLATILKLIGGFLRKLRCLLTGKKDNQPRHFSRDLIKHALKA
ncbi:MAG: N-acetylglucosaminyl-diphospho-decaprenol L-rhamnosyltransferase [Cellvibrionaceae bacterium]